MVWKVEKLGEGEKGKGRRESDARPAPLPLRQWSICLQQVALVRPKYHGTYLANLGVQELKSVGMVE